MALDFKKLGIDSTTYKVKERTPPKGYSNGEAVNLVAEEKESAYSSRYIVAERHGGGECESLEFEGTQRPLGKDLYHRLKKGIKKGKRLPEKGKLTQGLAWN